MYLTQKVREWWSTEDCTVIKQRLLAMHYCWIVFSQWFGYFFNKVVLFHHICNCLRCCLHDWGVILFLVCSIKLKWNQWPSNAEHGNYNRLGNPYKASAIERLNRLSWFRCNLFKSLINLYLITFNLWEIDCLSKNTRTISEKANFLRFKCITDAFKLDTLFF